MTKMVQSRLMLNVVSKLSMAVFPVLRIVRDCCRPRLQPQVADCGMSCRALEELARHMDHTPVADMFTDSEEIARSFDCAVLASVVLLQ